MCIAIWKKEGMELTEGTINNSWNSNPHGAGFMYAEDGKIVIEKGFMTLDAFKEAYEPHKLKECALHFRIRTHGETNAENTHPFRINEEMGLIHNGIMTNVKCDIDTKMSDTWHFVEKYMKPMHPLWQTACFKDLVEEFIGYSKLVIMHGDGNTEIYGEQLGYWDADCWFSNQSYKPVVYAPYKAKPKDTKAHIDKRVMTTGDEVVLLWDTKVDSPDYEGEIIAKGKIVKVLYFSSGTNITIENPITGKTACVPRWHVSFEEETKPEVKQLPRPIACDYVQEVHTFKFADEAVFTRDYGDFKVGDTVLIDRVTENFLIVERTDSMTNKTYSIPKACLTPFNALFH